MAVVGVIHGQLMFLKRMIEGDDFAIGLFKNDRRPAREDALLQYHQADFDGYAGVQPITNWTEPTMRDGRAYTEADSVAWLHNGGPIDNLIFGYFVVDSEGLLVWVERFPAGPRVVSATARDCVVLPVLTETSEF